MGIKGISHIGIGVEDLEKAIENFKSLGLVFSGTEEVPEQKVKVAFMETGGTRIELLESTDPTGPIGQFIEKRGQGIHHIALEVEGLEEKLVALDSADIRLIDKKPRKGAHNTKIAFIHPKATNGTLIELCESE